MTTLAPDLVLMARQTVQIASFSSEDADGKPTYGADVAHRGRISSKTVRVRDARGQEIVAAGFVRLTRQVTVGTKDRLTLPASVIAPILHVASDPDEFGAVPSTVVYFGEAS